MQQKMPPSHILVVYRNKIMGKVANFLVLFKICVRDNFLKSNNILPSREGARMVKIGFVLFPCLMKYNISSSEGGFAITDEGKL